MGHRRLVPAVVFVIALMGTLSLASKAQARRGLVLITHGTQFKHLADVPSDKKQMVAEGTGTANATIGYKYESFGVFWLNIWTWEGEYCLLDGDTDLEISEAELQQILGQEPGKLGKPWSYRFPPGLLVIIVGGAILVALGIFNKSDEVDLSDVANDPRYREAFEILQSRATDEVEAAGEDEPIPGWNEAIQLLATKGIPKNEAEKNLSLLVQAVMAQTETDHGDN